MIYAFKNENKTINIISESITKAKKGLIPDFRKIVMGELWNKVEFNKSESYVTFPNGSVIRFISGADYDKVVGLRSDILYADEVNTIKKEVLDVLQVRTRYLIFASFNPVSIFEWYEENSKSPGFVEDISNYLDNPFLEQTIIDDILERARKSRRFKQIHIDGLFASLEGLVLQEDIGDGGDWEVIEELPSEGIEKEYYALDFGFKHKTAIVHVIIIGKSIYIEEVLYKSNIVNREISDEIKLVNPKNLPVVADSAEPRAIEELRRIYGLKMKAISKLTLEDSINNWREHAVFITSVSKNLLSELRTWEYDKKKKNKFGRPVPVNEYDDLIAASRYGLDHHFRPKSKQPITIVEF